MKTKVLLMMDVENLGRVGDVVEVAGGYARNYLLPRGLAARPTAPALRKAQRERERLEKERQARIARLEELAARLSGVQTTVAAAANEEGHLYGSVSARDIVHALAEKGFELQPSQVRMEHALREVGEHPVTMHLGEGVDAEIQVIVIRAEQAQKAEPASGGEPAGEAADEQSAETNA